jgi:hypothetical protein
MEENFNALSGEQLKNLFQSVLTAYSFNLLMLAQKIGNTDEETLHKIKEYFIKNKAAMIYSVTELGEHPEAEEYMGKAVDALLSENKPHDGNVKLRLMILSIPYL